MDEIFVDKMQFYGKKLFAGLSLALAILFTVPTIAIMASWNSLPGDRLYSTKRYLENIALKIVGNNFTVRADLQTQFVEHRFNEAETLLAQSSNSGLNELSQQIQVTKTDIIAVRDRSGGKDAVVAQEKAEKLSIQLQEYSQKLEASKYSTSEDTTPSKTVRNVTTTATPVATTTTAKVDKQVVAPSKVPSVASPTTIPVVTTQSAISSGDALTVEDLQEEIAKAIEELKDKKEKKGENTEDSKEQFKNASPEEKVEILKDRENGNKD